MVHYDRIKNTDPQGRCFFVLLLEYPLHHHLGEKEKA